MKNEISVKSLKDVFTKLSKVFVSNSKAPIFENVLVEVTEDHTFFTTENSYIRATVKVENEEKADPGKQLFNFKKLHAFIKKTKANTIVFDDEKVKSNKIELKLNNENNVNDFPVMPDHAYNYIAVSKKEYANAISKVSYAVFKSDSRPALKGICNTVIDGNMIFIATDSHRLAKHVINDVTIYKETSYQSLTDGKLMDKVIKMFDKTDSAMKVGYNDINTKLEFDNVEIWIRNIEGNYPDTNRIIPDYFNTELKMNKVELLESLEQMELIYKNSRNSVTDFSYKNNKDNIVLSAENEEKDKMISEIGYYGANGEELDISFSGSYLSEALKVCNSDMLELQFISRMRPFIVRDGDNTMHLILPIRRK